MKKLLAKVMTVLIMIVTVSPTNVVQAATKNNDLNFNISTTNSYLLDNNKLEFGQEWYILGIARSGYKVEQNVYDEYYKSVEEAVKEEMKKDEPFYYITTAQRLIIALTAIGKDPTNVAGYNLVDIVYNREDIGDQGTNAYIYGLISIDTKGYEAPANSKNTRESFLKGLLDSELKDGGFSWGPDVDVDTTAMAVQALAPYKDRENVKEVINRCLDILKSKQSEDAGYSNQWGESPCSIAQVLVALTSLNLDPTDASNGFVKNGRTLVDAAKSYYVEGGGYKSSSTATNVDSFSTQQLHYATVAQQRYLDGKFSLYNMNDVVVNKEEKPSAPIIPDKGEEIPSTPEDNKVQSVENEINKEQVENKEKSETDTIKTGDNNYVIIVFAMITMLFIATNIKKKRVI